MEDEEDGDRIWIEERREKREDRGEKAQRAVSQGEGKAFDEEKNGGIEKRDVRFLHRVVCAYHAEGSSLGESLTKPWPSG